MSNGRSTTAPQPERSSQTSPRMGPPAPEAAGPRVEGEQAGPDNTAMTGMLEDGGYLMQLGGGVRLDAENLEGDTRLTAQLSELNLGIPGLRLTEFIYNKNRERGQVKGELSLPHVKADELAFSLDREGNASLSTRARAETNLPALNNPTLDIGLDEDQQLSARLEVEGARITPRRLRKLNVEGSGVIELTEGRLSGNLNFDLAYQDLAQGRVNLRFSEEGRLSGDGSVEITQPFLAGTRAELQAREDGSLSGSLSVPASQLQPPVPGLTLAQGTITLNYENQALSGTLEDVKMTYQDLGEATLNGSIDGDQAQGSGTFDLNLPGFEDVTGEVGYNRQGRFYGRFGLGANDFPEGLPVRSGRIRGSIDEEGAVDFSGKVIIQLASVGTGEFTASYQDGQTEIGATVNLTDLPGLESATVEVKLIGGQLEGSADIAVDNERLPGIGATLHVEYRDNLWSAEQEVDFSVDDGRLHGSITLGLEQTEEEDLNIYGGGDVTAEIAPNLEGTLEVTVNPDGTVETRGEIRVPEPIELFPEEPMERELFKRSINVPLWAILVAVIRLRAGVRAGVGPGVLRDITVTGEYTIGAEEQPTFSVTGELYIPAFAEAYLGIGAGLGLDVKLGSLTGGIEGMATAGIYGAVSVVPELAYEDGDYLIEGTATLAAGAKFKLNLNAWAEIEALWKTIWEEEWELAEWVWDLGPQLALQAQMSYNFSDRNPPSIEVKTEDIPEADQLIKDAIPKDGPPPSGAREALDNKAEWQGPTREKREDEVPSDLAERAKQSAPPEQAPKTSEGGANPQSNQQPENQGGSRRQAKAEAPNPDARGREESSGTTSAGAPSPDREREQENAREEAAKSPVGQEQTVTEDEVPNADQPRYPDGVSLATLEEPPAPTPRTKAQQKEDLEAAEKVLKLADRKADDSAALEDYFLPIKERFRLSRIAFVEVGNQIKVELAINPSIKVTNIDKARGSGIAGKKTKIDYGSGQLYGHTVGITMTAHELGPDHPRGESPRAHKPLMDKLGDRYIRGHLLNDRLGGEGSEQNLFPITRTANAEHERKIESQVKQWVNQQRYWAFYKVHLNVRDQDVDLSHPQSLKELNSVSARLECNAAILTLDGRQTSKIAASIESEAPPPETMSEDFEERTKEEARESEKPEVRPEDEEAEIRLPARVGDYRLPASIIEDLERVLPGGDWSTDEAKESVNKLKDALVENVSGVGSWSADVLVLAYKKRNRGNLAGDLSSNQKNSLTRILNHEQQILNFLRSYRN